MCLQHISFLEESDDVAYSTIWYDSHLVIWLIIIMTWLITIITQNLTIKFQYIGDIVITII